MNRYLTDNIVNNIQYSLPSTDRVSGSPAKYDNAFTFEIMPENHFIDQLQIAKCVCCLKFAN